MDEVMGAESAGFLFFGEGRGEGGDMSSEYAGKLDGEVAEAANTDNADARGGIDAVNAHGIVDSDSAAEKRRGLFAGPGVVDGEKKAGVGGEALGVAAVTMNAGSFRGGAEVLLAAHTPLTLAA